MIPEIVPERIVVLIGNSGIKTHLGEFPAFLPADRLRKSYNIIVWVAISEAFTNRMIKVLAVDEGNRAFNGWLDEHCPSIKK